MSERVLILDITAQYLIKASDLPAAAVQSVPRQLNLASDQPSGLFPAKCDCISVGDELLQHKRTVLTMMSFNFLLAFILSEQPSALCSVSLTQCFSEPFVLCSSSAAFHSRLIIIFSFKVWMCL